MRKPIRISFFILTLFLFSCGADTSNNGGEAQLEPEPSRYGGVFKMPIDSYFKLIPVNEIQKHEETQIYGQIYEGLVKYNGETLELEPCLASSWEISEDGMSYKFVIRDDVYFHDNVCFEGGKGRKMNADDVVFSINRIFDPKQNNSCYPMFKNTIEGGDEYYDGIAENVSGVSADGNVVTIKLNNPGLSFLKKMASVFGAIIPEEAVDASTANEVVVVGTGPFVYDAENSNSENVKLFRNKKYYGVDERGESLPYLDSIYFLYYDNLDGRMEPFWNGELTYIPQVPISKISEVLEERISDFESKPPKYILTSEPQLNVTYLELNMQTRILKKKKVRQAINLAINRNKIVEKVMKNQAYEIGKFGVTPPLPKVFEGYDFEGVEDVSYTYNSRRAKELLAEAGYPNGKNFPSLEMQFPTGRTAYLIVSEVQSQLKSVLNINVDVEALDFDQLLENKAMGEGDIVRTTWIADFPSPEAFLANFYGKIVPKKGEPSYVNTARYKNDEFDAAFEKGVAAVDVIESNKYFSEAEKILMEDPPFIVLSYGEDMALKLANLRDFQSNGIGYLDLRTVFFRTPKIEENK